MCLCSPLQEVLTTGRPAKSKGGTAAVRQCLHQCKCTLSLIRGQSALDTYTLVRNIIQLSIKRQDMNFSDVNKDKGIHCFL